MTFEAMPEVREVLDAHLDLQIEPTLSIRSVYGRHLTSLASLDWDWFRANLDRILPTGQDDPPRFNTAWESFVGFNQPHPILLPVLMPAYQRAVRQVATPSLTKRRAVSPEDRLVEHLMVYYWLGKLKFGADDRLLGIPLSEYPPWVGRNRCDMLARSSLRDVAIKLINARDGIRNIR